MNMDANKENLSPTELRSIVMQAIGEASMCWSDPGRAGVFDSTQAIAIGDRLCETFGLPTTPKMPEPMDRAFAKVINQQCAENGSNTPDFILGSFLSSVLCALDAAIASRDNWYGVKLEPGQPRCREYDWENGERVTINVGAIFKIGRRLWRFKGVTGKEQGNDLWHFESTEPTAETRGGCPMDRLFTRSEVQWLYSHGSFVGHPVEAEGVAL